MAESYYVPRATSPNGETGLGDSVHGLQASDDIQTVGSIAMKPGVLA